MNRSKKMTAWLIGLSLGLLGLVHSVMAANGLQAQVSANTVGLGDTVTLTLSADTDHVTNHPDITPLRTDFELLGQSTRSQAQIINGKRSATTSWLITLSPKAIGSFEIPAISAGNIASDPLSIDVVDAASLPTGASTSQDLDVEVVIDNKPHYVHSEIPVTVRVIDGAGLSQATLQPPTGADFTLRQTGEDNYQQTQRNGRPVTVMQRHYLLTPLKSGELTVPPIQLEGTVPASANSSATGLAGPAFPSALPRGFGPSMFGSSLFESMFNPGQPVRVLSEPLSLTIKANPVTDSKWFLPAKDVQLSAEWAQPNPTYKVGEAVSRTVRLLALGAAQEKLPKLEFTDADGARIYLDRTNDKSADTPQGTAAIREFQVSIVPTRPGDITLPGIDVHWWDTEADKPRIASIPAESIFVVGGAINDMANNASSATNSNNSAVVNITSDGAANDRTEQIGIIGWLWKIGLALLSLITGMTLYKRLRNSPSASLNDVPGRSLKSSKPRNSRLYQQKLKQLHRRVVFACKANQPEAAYAAYLSWQAEARSETTGFFDRSSVERTAFQVEREKLEARLYQSTTSKTWQGAEFLAAFEKLSAAQSKCKTYKTNNAVVPALYPAHSAL